jgi:hypothetical protein
MRHAERGERQESHHTRCHPDENSDHEGGLHGSPPLASDVINEPVARAKLGVARQRAPPFDEPARNIAVTAATRMSISAVSTWRPKRVSWRKR